MSTSVQPLRVLVVDDSPMDRRLAGRLLEKRANTSVDYAEDGKAALGCVAQKRPDLVLTDLHMPELDGLALVDAVRKEYADLPIILMTAHGSEEVAMQALRRGAASYVPKRGLAKELIDTVENVLGLLRADRDQRRVHETLDYVESSFILDNDPAVLPPILGHLEAQVVGLGLCDGTEALQLGVALREALVNAMLHGNLEVSSRLLDGEDPGAFHQLAAARRKELPYRERRVTFTVRHARHEARYTVRDEGPGFDPGELPDPMDISNLDRPYGRGLLLIGTFMDDVKHNATGNEIVMIKRAASTS